MEFIGTKTDLAKSAKVFGTLGGIASIAGVTYFIITKFSNMLMDVMVGAVTGIAIGVTYGCVRFIVRGSTPRVVIENGIIRKEDLKKEKAALSQVQKLERRKEDLVIHLDKGKMVINELMGYPVDEIYRYLKKQIKHHRPKKQ